MPGPTSLKGASRTVVSRTRQGPQAPLTGRLPLWCSSYAENAVISVIARPVFAQRPWASVRGAPVGRVLMGIYSSLCNNGYGRVTLRLPHGPAPIRGHPAAEHECTGPRR